MSDELGLDKELVRQALAEQPGGLVSVRRPDGTCTLLSRTVAEWYVTDSPAPNESDLDVLFDGATRVRVLERTSVWGEGGQDDELCHADVSDPSALVELRARLRHQDTGAHRLSTCDLAIEVHGPEGVRGALAVIHLSLLRWQRWKTDARLGGGLGEWIAAHGSDAPLRAAQARRAAQEDEAWANAAARARWAAAMPAPLRDAWERVATEEVVQEPWNVPTADLAPALAAHHASPVPAEALLAWLAERPYTGTGWCGEELLAHRLVRELLSDDALEAGLIDAPPPVVSGARRFLEWHGGSHPRQPVRAHRRFKARHEALVARLTAICPALGRSD